MVSILKPQKNEAKNDPGGSDEDGEVCSPTGAAYFNWWARN
jgi:hypothetical protein